MAQDSLPEALEAGLRERAEALRASAEILRGLVPAEQDEAGRFPEQFQVHLRMLAEAGALARELARAGRAGRARELLGTAAAAERQLAEALKGERTRLGEELNRLGLARLNFERLSEAYDLGNS